MPNAKENYIDKVIPALKEKFGYANVFAVPKLEKIVVNTGVGRIVNTFKGSEGASGELSSIEDIIEEMTLITGQKPQIIRAKKSISGFKLRQGMISGLRVVLRGGRMYDFLARLRKIAFPRSRDFRGIYSKCVDEHGNMTIGIKEQMIFPDIPHDKVRKIWGMEITIVTNARIREEGLELLKQLGVPFQGK